MRHLALLITISLIPALAQEKKAPQTVPFQTKMGKVTYNHAAHATRVKNECATCHDKLFQQSAAAPLNYKPAMHRTAEAKEISCGFCHRPGGTAFQSKGSCNKCHVRSGAKS